MNEEFSWDSEIDESAVESASTASSEFVCLPEGAYRFTVKKVNNRRYQPKPGKTSGITTPCNEKSVGLYIEGPNGSASFVWESFYEHPSSAFNAINFFRCLGLIPEGERFKGVLPWNDIVGKSGWADFSVDSWNPEKPKNRVKGWYAPSKAPAPELDDEF